MTTDLSAESGDWFEQWFGSPYYRILYQHRDEAEAEKFISNLLATLNPEKGASMLDIACGEGRYAIHLADQGYDVTGIDLSVRNIEAAKKHEHEYLHFLVQDMRFMFYTNFFDYAFNFFTSFGYFRYDRDNHLAARAFAAALKPGGTLVMDYFNADWVLKNLVSTAVVERQSVTFNIKKRFDGRRIIKEINFIDANGRERNYTEYVAAFSLSDFTSLFGAAGLTLERTFGDYDLNPFDAAVSPRLIMLFKK